eukprot:50325_1
MDSVKWLRVMPAVVTILPSNYSWVLILRWCFFCVNDGNGNYVLSTADPTAHPSTATANPSTAKPTGNPSTAEPSTADPTTADPTFAEGQVDEGTSEATQSEESTEFVGSEKEPSFTDSSLVMVISIASVVLSVICLVCVYRKWKKGNELSKAAQDAIMVSNDTNEIAPQQARVVSLPQQPQVNHTTVKYVDDDDDIEQESDAEDKDADDLYVVHNDGATRDGSTKDGSTKDGSVAKCDDCGVVKSGKIYEQSGSFYCWDCWKLYE